MSREAIREAFAAYRTAVLDEAAARDAHYFARRTKAPCETDLALIRALGRLGEARAALDHAILDAHDLTATKADAGTASVAVGAAGGGGR